MSRIFARRFGFAAVAAASLVAGRMALAADKAARSPSASTALPSSSLRLTSAALASQPEPTQQTTTVRVVESDESWEIDGPVFLRSADPEEPGELVVKNIFGWEHHREGADNQRDQYEYELEIEYGLVEDHELIFEVPFQVGDARVEGNGDLTIGWHWRLFDEVGSHPAVALRNFVRLPTGVDSNGVDYELRGLITKTITPGCTRLHLNPFAKSVNGDNEEEARHFRWGAAVGFDHHLRDDLLLIADYIYSNGEEEHTRDNHEAELGIDWELDERQELGIAATVGLDGDTNEAAFGARISYMLHFGG